MLICHCFTPFIHDLIRGWLDPARATPAIDRAVPGMNGKRIATVPEAININPVMVRIFLNIMDAKVTVPS
ncbi:MAG: hypothetical protein HY730_10125 [Candidatus Tectomicrobia bacterium]|uniref:Uncharacterized protein n=1 Tax=Tectimicrobiota bacterium TaxID=2528274 RepID=A0A933GNK4_UNCTE|nr:hypothetical protein [Candidatus Tectomicrobia bacterium]